MLDYSGFGSLNGIPGKCVDMDSGADADCSQGGNGNNSIRWVPQFTIPGLTTVTATDPATNASTDCYVKPLEVGAADDEGYGSGCLLSPCRIQFQRLHASGFFFVDRSESDRRF